MKKNHQVVSTPINFVSKTGSRNRLRVTTAGARNCDIKPGDRVRVFIDLNMLEVAVEKDPKGNYKVEKNGGIRFPAHKFGLPSDNVLTSADSLHKKVSII